MNQQQQVSNSFPSPGIPLKRKRGRPRKEKTLDPGNSTSYVPPKKDPSQNRSETAPIPPGFEQANGNTATHSVNTATDNNNEDSMVGQVVTGVIEAVFEAGYLLSVRVGESDTSLRGVVFKAGRYVPVSAENDVAPNLQMIRRNEVPFPPSANQGQKRRGRQRREHHTNGSPPPNNQLALVRPRPMPIVPVQSTHPVGERGTVVPVVLQPINLSNGATPALQVSPGASQPAHLAASKGKQINVTQATSGPASQPFEDLVSVAKKMQGSSPVSAGTQHESGTTSSKMLQQQEQAEDLSKPLLVKPLQAVRSNLCNPSATESTHAFPERRTGKMTELLLAVQENLKERQMAESQHHNFRSPEN